jgi:hypothetical protein
MMADTSAIVLATFAGPVAAVGVSLWREHRRDIRQLRFNVFRMLMATRRLSISLGQVEAINTVEVAFHGVPQVEKAHHDYITHLNNRIPDSATDDVVHQWENRRQDLLAVLISKIAKSLKIAKGEIDIRSGGYAPEGWAVRDTRDGQLRTRRLRYSEAASLSVCRSNLFRHRLNRQACHRPVSPGSGDDRRIPDVVWSHLDHGRGSRDARILFRSA